MRAIAVVERHALASTLLGRPSIDHLACWTAESSKQIRVRITRLRRQLLSPESERDGSRWSGDGPPGHAVALA
jgi:hypothetical protein